MRLSYYRIILFITVSVSIVFGILALHERFVNDQTNAEYIIISVFSLIVSGIYVDKSRKSRKR